MQKCLRSNLLRKFSTLFGVVLLASGQLAAQQADYKSIVNRYIIQYRDIAVREMTNSRIPASITMAQGILESNAGQSVLAKEANNHFGIKCHEDWTGETMYKDDDHPNECFRKYGTAQESFRDHSFFLVSRDRYKILFQLKITDYKGWALGLKKAGYATSPTYAEQLIKTIETFKLYKFDRGDFGAALVDSLNYAGGDYSKMAWVKEFEVVEVSTDNHRIFVNNKLRVTVVKKGDDLQYLCTTFNISEKNLMKYNDLTDSHLVPGQIIYLQSKRRKAANSTHVFQQGETLYQISQGYGIKIKMLYKRNHIPKGMEPPAGLLLRLR